MKKKIKRLNILEFLCLNHTIVSYLLLSVCDYCNLYVSVSVYLFIQFQKKKHFWLLYTYPSHH